MGDHVVEIVRGEIELLEAGGAGVGLFLGVRAHVALKVVVLSERFAALSAHERADLLVDVLDVPPQVLPLIEDLVTDVALVLEFLRVDGLDVDDEAAALREALAAEVALVRLRLRVRYGVRLEALPQVGGVAALRARVFLLLRAVRVLALHVLLQRVVVSEHLAARRRTEAAGEDDVTCSAHKRVLKVVQHIHKV